ncbi:MAG: hypothetical protein Tsb0021_15590 [Chlamydiales bacterium]
MNRYFLLFFLLMAVGIWGEVLQETPWQPDIALDPERLNQVIETYYEDPNKKVEQNKIDLGQLWEEEEIKKSKKSQKYRLQIGDQLIISVYGFNDYDTERLVTVEPTGNISYLFIDSIPAVGRYIEDVRRDIERRVKEVYPNTLVAVSASQLIGNKYTILGEVNNPGTKLIFGNMTVLKAIAEANGFPIRGYRGQIIDFADLDKAFLARNGNYIPINFRKLVRQGDTSQDVALEGGDYLYIPSLMSKSVYVLGEVVRSSIYNYLHQATLAEVLAWSGDVTRDADRYIVVLRGALDCPTHYLVDYCKIKKGLCPDFILQPGDIVYVPRNGFTALRDVVRSAINTFVGAVAITAGENGFVSIVPDASGIINDSIIINPGTTVQAIPVVGTSASAP